MGLDDNLARGRSCGATLGELEDRGRRRVIGGAAALLLVGGCGGGGSDRAEDAPAIHDFAAAAPVQHIGERARLTARFVGGPGRIEPDIGRVHSGVPVDTPVLDSDRSYTLIVEVQGQAPLQRELRLRVAYRDRYRPLHVPFALQYHAAVTVADGSVLVIGGSRGGPLLSDHVERFDPATLAFTRVGQMRTGRCDHTATRLGDGRVLVLGGQSSLAIAPAADLIDEAGGAVSDGGRLQLPRSRHAAVALADGGALVVGGIYRDTVERWDPQTRRFRLVAARMAHVREFASATLLDDGRVLIAGGGHAALQHRFAEIFDPRTETFEPVADEVRPARSMHQAFKQADGSVLIVGGEEVDEAADPPIVPLASVLRFDPARGRFEVLPALDRARSLVRGLQLPDGRIVMFGGWEAHAGPGASASSYRVGAPGLALAAMPQARCWHTVCRLHDGRMLILGGDDADAQPVAGGLIYE